MRAPDAEAEAVPPWVTVRTEAVPCLAALEVWTYVSRCPDTARAESSVVRWCRRSHLDHRFCRSCRRCWRLWLIPNPTPASGCAFVVENLCVA